MNQKKTVKKLVMRGLVGPLNREMLTKEQKDWRLRSQRSLEKILALHTNRTSRSIIER